MKREIIGNRRTFIKGAAILGGLAVLFGIGPGPAVGKPTESLPKPEPSGQGYRLTE
ncbi:MAG: twin-arginine translocation signal domain-containing protein, partial [Proteobacteria bacterium]|nr:twin-arginine translocation signal domain-containing protein [Pseudomonadota bacterium]